MDLKETLKIYIDKFKGALSRKEQLLGVDIGTSSVRVVLFGETGEILKAQCEPITADCFTGGVIAKPDKVGAVIRKICDSMGISELRAATAVPVSSVFSTKIKIPKVAKKDLRATITLEAAASIPHPIEAVSIDYQILKVHPEGKLEVLVVAVKNEILQSYQETFMEAALELALIDIDAHAIENAIVSTPGANDQAIIALINIGARYASLNIICESQSLVTGDISVGGKHLTEAIVAELKVSNDEAENLKKNIAEAPVEIRDRLEQCVKKYVDNLAGDINRRLSLLWSSAGHEGTITSVVLSGAGSQCSGLLDAVSAKTGIETKFFNPFKEFSVSNDIVTSVLAQGPRFGIACGLAKRSPGDRIYPEGALS